MTKTAIAEAFSNGEFESVYAFISDQAEWTVIEENEFIGKKAIVDHCEQVSKYFKSVTTNFQTFSIIADDNKVVIHGTAEFLSDNERISFVSACDIYEFNDKGEIHKITSYCIPSKSIDLKSF